MLEILGIILLCNINKKNVVKKGRKPGSFIAITIGLWIGLEIVGAGLGTALQLGLGTYLLAILFAIIGGVISFVIAKNAAPQPGYVPQASYTYAAQGVQPVAASHAPLYPEPAAAAGYAPLSSEPSAVTSADPEPQNPAAMDAGKNTAPEARRLAGSAGFSMAAVFLAGAIFVSWLLLFLLHYLLPDLGRSFNILYNTRAPFLMADILLGTGVYLLLQREVKFKWFGVGVFAGSVVVLTLSNTMYRVISIHSQMNMPSGANLTIDYLSGVWRDLGNALLPAIAASGTVLLLDYLWANKDENLRVLQAGWIVACSVLVCNIINVLLDPYLNFNVVTLKTGIIIFVGDIAAFLTVGLTVLFLSYLCNQKSHGIHLSGWGIAWCVLCGVGMLSSIGLTFAPNLAYSVQLLFAIAALAGFILLLCKNRIGFFVVLAAAYLYLSSQFLASLDQAIAPASGIAGNQYASLLAGSISGALTIIITWISIQRAWRLGALSDGTAVAQEKTARALPKTASIVNLVLCALIFGGASGIIIGGNGQGGTVFVMALSMAGVCLSICAIPSLFSQRIPYRRWLDIMMRIGFFVICSVLVAALLVALFHMISAR